ncbi:MAG TPA: tRNA 2-selenouridine(34) synthase MnmH [Bacteroidales bacterium]|nr:tRNA 2-selenouridine(34) synthase MnmH [Bacteroidales bacterium]
MTHDKLEISAFLDKSNTAPVIDVRSPAEFTRGHIPGAVNLPLFTNEERSVVGTLYLKKGSSEAMIKGLELIGPKMKQFAEEGLELAKDGELLIHCWRGGMRSNSMAWLFQTMGIRASTLEGGYKSYRHFVQESFDKPFNLIVIGGMTGSGKTEILEALEKKGHTVIHLERLASHKGSVFGGVGLPDQPTTEHFENLLSGELQKLDPGKPVFIEDESLAIGRVFIPQPFYSQMSSGRFIHVLVPVERRIKRLVEAYTGGDKKLLADGVKRIERRLGTENAAHVAGLINRGEMEKAVEIVLRYYDKVYSRSMSMRKRKEILEINAGHNEPGEIADNILTHHNISTFNSCQSLT